jgi:polysaccharide biosynthesis protein VpsQ
MKAPNLKQTNLEWILLAILYGNIFITILILAYTKNLPPLLIKNDKLGHIVLYGIATYLGHRVFQRRRLPILSFTVPLFPLIFGIFTVVEEAFQSLSPNRTLDALDLIASFGGILLGYWLVERERKSRAE